MNGHEWNPELLLAARPSSWKHSSALVATRRLANGQSGHLSGESQRAEPHLSQNVLLKALIERKLETPLSVGTLQ